MVLRAIAEGEPQLVYAGYATKEHLTIAVIFPRSGDLISTIYYSK